ncbi:MAG: Signal transduction histidine kinase involved in nitrogen fixation and metabolism regulation [Candidatus Kentron sp. G]|nr:MAG: Signal transduction histidine kinase involved in nitrogen fixation and metabolism regulation [Candidatus Kentron sp. G]VFM97092.1 MAG: Signal transduction histidine kinase involved in nitrogen fixation and metabolism regulation [Candidatus Kentron sp. G]VFM99962.1 MAG: Signal transduction histidine kinase involved in nitrogen fixation and metabolism regulation [Candidatus Kentron sp. G]
MKTSRIKRSLRGIVPIFALALLLLVSLSFMSTAIQEPSRFEGAFAVLGTINAIALVPLGILIGWNLLQLVRQVRSHVPGAHLTIRMVAMFVLLSVTPVLVVYYFSLTFLHRGIDSWFEVRIEEALEASLALSRSALDMRKGEVLKQTRSVADTLSDTPTPLIEHQLEDVRGLSGASELAVMTSKGQFLASSSIDPTSIMPHHPGKSALLQVRRTGLYISLDPIPGEGLHIRVIVSFPDTELSAQPRLLQGLFPLTQRVNQLTDSVQAAYTSYGDRALSRQELKGSFTLTLSLVLLLTLFSAVWAAFFYARRAVSPLRDLVNGTQAVARGDYETRLPRSGSGEIATLVKSFNDMMSKLASARDDAWYSRQQVEEQRRYLEAVLTRLSSGVITLDGAQCVFKVNNAAHRILGVDLNKALGNTLTVFSNAYPHLHPFAEVLSVQLNSGQDWRQEINLFGAGGRQTLLCRGTPLVLHAVGPHAKDANQQGHSSETQAFAHLQRRVEDSDNPFPGYLIVFDDITALIQAQRNAAWSEVARRLAHEIKNPLTPIQLSAERLRHKYLDRMPSEQAKTLDNLTRTIVQQVESMKTMANAFSDYARPPQMQPRLLDINELIRDTLELYRNNEPNGAIIETQFESGLSKLHADPDRMRQVVHNLTKNALEANQTPGEVSLIVETYHAGDSVYPHIEVVFRDRGSGFPAKLLEHAFEPHVTTKPRGTGLGLAIVKKIVEEHGGGIRAENNPDIGASIIMRFPASNYSARAIKSGLLP